MKPVQLLALLLAVGCARAVAQTGDVALRQPAAVGGAAETVIMGRIERDIRLPHGAYPLAHYDRYYAWHGVQGGARTVVALYVGANGRAGTRRWVAQRDLPGIDDGGCDVVSFSYEPATQRIYDLGCNGYA
jgi:hypothetical protein